MFKKYEFEEKLRHIICIFQGLETFLFCAVLLIACLDRDFLMQLKFHDKSLETVWPGLIICLIPIACNILSICFRGFFLFYEWLHAFIGFLAFLAVSSPAVGILFFLIASVRLICYLLIKNIYKSTLVAADQSGEEKTEIDRGAK